MNVAAKTSNIENLFAVRAVAAGGQHFLSESLVTEPFVQAEEFTIAGEMSRITRIRTFHLGTLYLSKRGRFRRDGGMEGEAFSGGVLEVEDEGGVALSRARVAGLAFWRTRLRPRPPSSQTRVDIPSNPSTRLIHAPFPAKKF